MHLQIHSMRDLHILRIRADGRMQFWTGLEKENHWTRYSVVRTAQTKDVYMTIKSLNYVTEIKNENRKQRFFRNTIEVRMRFINVMGDKMNA